VPAKSPKPYRSIDSAIIVGYHRRRVETVGYPRFRSRPPGPDVGPFAALMERWRGALGLSNRAFARMLGRSQPEWSLVQRGVRPVSRAIETAVLTRADEPWRSGFERALAQDRLAGRGAQHSQNHPPDATQKAER